MAQCEANLANIVRTQAEAEALQAAVNEDEEWRTAANAQRSDLAHEQDLSRALDAGRSFADTDSDVQACTGAVTYAVAAHNWAQTLDASVIRETSADTEVSQVSD
ncbi:hypothetical protein OVA07_11755 [Novosphingobium sp. SL115]|uniref:hypothetical protein n=1 Tax=Novosphingobium sp. SL115 TaxID=2995150 RepID=UPI002272474F|nr:hypothetical protein [Novosphingobium sp. SL115]MCY1671682.1 hypothetical protein [Novosphingobium sp. SL115]